ncbi:hypothetical protein B0H14DRAFT_3603760 [Mycena olivaceomarginata]|nr:hypothetical protein B0H14DRAFT_3603760 [Mycena olivaceomarginata]
MSDALKTLYNLDQSETWDIRKSIRFFDSEQFAALDQLRIRFGGILRSEAPHSPSGTWRHGDLLSSETIAIPYTTAAQRQKWWLKNLREQRPELFTPGSKLEQELNKEEVEMFSCALGIVTVPVQDGWADGRTDNRPVPSLSYGSPQPPVPSPDGGEDGRPVHPRTDGRTAATLCHVT